MKKKTVKRLRKNLTLMYLTSFSIPQDSKHRVMSKEGEGSGRRLTEGIPSTYQEVPGKTTKSLSKDSPFPVEI